MRSLFNFRRSSKPRLGTTAVEVAVTMPVFGMVMMGLMECGHSMMVVHTLNAAARQAARYGSTEAITTAQTKTKATTIVQNAFRITPTVIVKDGSTFDTANVDPTTINYSSLPDIELNTTKSDKLFIVRVSVPYDSAAILPPFWVKGITLTGHAVMRHE